MFQRERLYDSAPVHPWLLGTLGTLWASPFPSRLANRVWPNRVRHYPTDRLFTSRCSPPRLAATQLRSVTCGYMPARLGLSPCCLCALVGALGQRRPAAPQANGEEKGSGFRSLSRSLSNGSLSLSLSRSLSTMIGTKIMTKTGERQRSRQRWGPTTIAPPAVSFANSRLPARRKARPPKRRA